MCGMRRRTPVQRSELEVKYISVQGIKLNITVDGLAGGHSGAEIDKNRANANKVMGRFLHTLSEESSYLIAGLEGGTKDNVITKHSYAQIVVEPEEEAKVKRNCRKSGKRTPQRVQRF